jgi:hypothetical protein
VSRWSHYDSNLDPRPDSTSETSWRIGTWLSKRYGTKRSGSIKGRESCGLVGLGMRRSRNDKTVGGEKGAEDARWTGKGRAREWDRGKWCRRETRSKRWVWRLLGGGKAVGFSTTSGKRWIDRQMDGIAIGLQCYPRRYHGLAMQFCHVELQK